jgi:murein DD-endopeptidase MepM/ murein hydrolase activator NlpD
LFFLQLAIEHDDGTAAWYAHLREWLVQVGDVVTQGQPVAVSGGTVLPEAIPDLICIST